MKKVKLSATQKRGENLFIIGMFVGLAVLLAIANNYVISNFDEAKNVLLGLSIVSLIIPILLVVRNNFNSKPLKKSPEICFAGGFALTFNIIQLLLLGHHVVFNVIS